RGARQLGPQPVPIGGRGAVRRQAAAGGLPDRPADMPVLATALGQLRPHRRDPLRAALRARRAHGCPGGRLRRAGGPTHLVHAAAQPSEDATRTLAPRLVGRPTIPNSGGSPRPASAPSPSPSPG